LEPDGTPIQYVRPPFVVSLQKPMPRYYPVNRFLASWARRGLHEAQEVALGHLAQKRPPRDERAPWIVQSISLIHPTARRLAAEDSRFEVQVHSVFTPLPQACHVIRTMNIFNPGYFDEARLRSGAACVFDSLCEGGIWVLGRTTEETRPPRNAVSIFQKSGGSFRLLQQLNGGSDIEELVRREARESPRA
jgi:hypothetical protein